MEPQTICGNVLIQWMMHENPIDMPEQFVPETYYYLWDKQVLVGEYRIRHYLTEALKVGAGHIGYSIKKEYRGKGYGTKGLAMVLDIAREIVPVDEIYLRVLKCKIRSFKAINSNGAYIADEDETHYLIMLSNWTLFYHQETENC